MVSGKRVIKNYKIEEVIGEGAAATIYLASIIEGEDKGKMVAFKEYKKLNKEDLKLKSQRFSATKGIDNENILQPLDGNLRINAKTKYLVMELAYGSLKDVMKEYYGQPFPEKEIAAVLTHVSSGLDYLHSGGINIAHLDIKPSNILYQKSKNGQRKYVIADLDSSVDLRATVVKGQNLLELECTPEYASPEQLAPNYRGQKESDIFTLGMTIYELMTGTLINRDNGQLATGNIYIPGGYSQKLKSIVEQCLAKEPQNRPSAKLLRSEGQYFLDQGRWAGESSEVIPPHPSPSPIQPKPTKSRLLLYIAVMVLLGGGVWFGSQYLLKPTYNDLLAKATPFREVGGTDNLTQALTIYENAIEAYPDIDGEAQFESQNIRNILNTYQDIRPFKSGLAAVKNKESKWGFVDERGELLIDCVYDDVGDFNSSFTFIATGNEKEKKYGFIDTNGKETIEQKKGNGAALLNNNTGIIYTSNNKELKFDLTSGKQLAD